MYYCIYSSPFGDIALTANELGLTALSFLAGEQPLIIDEQMKPQPARFIEVTRQLTEYFCGTRRKFDLPLAASGTPFQQAVWHALGQIPYGESRSYAWLAQTIEHDKAVRAVGAANGANPIALIVPCHRVIGSNGKLTGYAGGLALKQKLLLHEGVSFKL
jgi:methylated-DNA-[protein]-cysteine S-methyltransferase